MPCRWAILKGFKRMTLEKRIAVIRLPQRSNREMRTQIHYGGGHDRERTDSRNLFPLLKKRLFILFLFTEVVAASLKDGPNNTCLLVFTSPPTLS